MTDRDARHPTGPLPRNADGSLRLELSAPLTVAQRRAHISVNLAFWDGALRELQDECEHTFATREPHASTGHYDPSCDTWWYDFDCEDCGKRWRESQP